MGLIGGMMKAGIAKKVFDEARKPHNQQKAKDLFHKVTGKGGGTSGGSTGTTGTGTPGAPRRP